MHYRYFIIGLTCAVLCQVGNAQTTLSGDHVITGNLDVGTTGTPGNLEVSGETGNTAAPGIKVTGDGGVLFEGTTGTGQIPASGPGDRFMWYSKKAALRAGSIHNTGWDDARIGTYSVALGAYSIAQGYNSSALSSGYSEGDYSFTASLGTAYSIGATAFSEGIAYGVDSTAMSSGYADGFSSVAMSGGVAVAPWSVAAGFGTQAQSYQSVALGSFTAHFPNASVGQWEDTDPILVVGNGTGSFEDPPERQRSNAFVIYKNGNIEIPKRQGDILMGEFGNPE